MEREKILVLGSTGMIGGYLMPVLARTGMPLVGTYASHAPEVHETASKHADPELIHFDYLVDDPAELIGCVRPKLVINLLHGTSEALRTCTMRLVELVAHEQIRYVFMSSSMAFDADLSHEHYETDTPAGESEYGRLKSTCEAAIRAHLSDHVILRISATHGAARGRATRTERFLSRLTAGETIDVDEGVIQNRLWTGDVAEMAAAAALSAETGVFHIGTTDSSTEHEFLSRLARAFGHDASLVVKKASVTRNLVVVPDRIWSLPGVSKITEAESIERIASDPSLQKYLK